MSRRTVTRAAILLLVLLVAGGLVGFNLFRDKMIAEFFANRPQPVVAISATEAKRAPWRGEVEAIGTARASQGVDLAVQTSGVVKEILFRPNDRVHAGQILLRIDDAVERAELSAAEADLTLAKAQLRRQTELRQRGVASQSTLDEAEARVASAGSALQRLRAVLDQKEIEAPFPGVIGIPQLDLGSYVQPGAIVATLQNLDTMQVDFTVPEQLAAEIGIGQTVNFQSDTSDTIHAGRIIGIDPKVDPQTRLVSVRAEVANSGGRLRPGEFVRAYVILPEQAETIVLPQTAVVTSLYGTYVYRLEKTENALTARQVFVQAGRRSGGIVEILAGVEPGQLIVSSGQNKLQNGTPVEINNSIDPAALSKPAPTHGAAGQSSLVQTPVPSAEPPAAQPSSAEAPSTQQGAPR